jgi:hypothetical protein
MANKAIKTVKTSKKKLETLVSDRSLRKFRSRCKKLKVSMAQRLRYLVENDNK